MYKSNKITAHVGFLIFISIIISMANGAASSDLIMNRICRDKYPVEKHKVETKDGYILSLHRIPKIRKPQKERKVVLLLHGFADSAGAFLSHNKGKSFAYRLYEDDFDVWLLNNRGSIHSQKHINLSSTDPEFWDFSWHEVGIYDISATVDYILNHINQTKLAFVGVSQGCTAILVLLSEQPEYNDRISIVSLLAPAVFFKYLTHRVPKSMEFWDLLSSMLQFGGVMDVTPFTFTYALQAVGPLCSLPIGRELCRNIICSLFGPSSQYFDNMILTMSDHYPSGSSYKQLVHYGQLSITGKFQKFHFNESKNIEMYGNATAPEYDLSKIRTKIHILYGVNDTLAPPDNIPLLVDKLGSNVVAINKFYNMNHIDFIYGYNLKILHKKMLKILRTYY